MTDDLPKRKVPRIRVTDDAPPVVHAEPPHNEKLYASTSKEVQELYNELLKPSRGASRPPAPPTARQLRIQELFDSGKIDAQTGLPVFLVLRLLDAPA